MGVARALPIAPDPLAVARALADRPGLAVLVSRPQGVSRPDDARFSFVASDPVEASDDLVPPARGPASAVAWNGLRAGPNWIGVVPYEAMRGGERPGWTRSPDDRSPCLLARPAWRRYAAVVRIDHKTGDVAVEADDLQSADILARSIARRGAFEGRGGAPGRRPRAPGHLGLDLRGPQEAEGAHLERVAAALRLIAAGDLYQVNLARRIQLILRGDPIDVFESLLEAAPAPWGFFHDLGEALVIGASPELALSVRDDKLRTCPIKGTRPRGSEACEDVRLARALEGDPKERAELVMAVDVHRNDLGRVAVPGSVRVLGDPRVIAGKTVWSRVAEVVARRAPGVSLDGVVRALLPCGSVTGAPKVRAMEVVARLEPWRRGLYTGAFGYVTRDGGLELAMAIRTIQAGAASGVEGERRACYFAGGGIVADSKPEFELEETRWKALQIHALSSDRRQTPSRADQEGAR